MRQTDTQVLNNFFLCSSYLVLLISISFQDVNAHFCFTVGRKRLRESRSGIVQDIEATTLRASLPWQIWANDLSEMIQEQCATRFSEVVKA